MSIRALYSRRPTPRPVQSPVQVDGQLRVPLIGRPLRLAVGVGIAPDPPVLLPHQIGVRSPEGCDAPGKLFL